MPTPRRETLSSSSPPGPLCLSVRRFAASSSLSIYSLIQSPFASLRLEGSRRAQDRFFPFLLVLFVGGGMLRRRRWGCASASAWRWVLCVFKDFGAFSLLTGWVRAAQESSFFSAGEVLETVLSGMIGFLFPPSFWISCDLGTFEVWAFYYYYESEMLWVFRTF